MKLRMVFQSISEIDEEGEHAITGRAQREVLSDLALWWTHVFRKRVTQLRHCILALSTMNVHLFLLILLGLARVAQARRA